LARVRGLRRTWRERNRRLQIRLERFSQKTSKLIKACLRSWSEMSAVTQNKNAKRSHRKVYNAAREDTHSGQPQIYL
jgi:hypothetical protein